MQGDAPVVFDVRGTEQRDVGAGHRARRGMPAVPGAPAVGGRAVGALSRLPVPPAVVLNLPGPRVSGAQAHDRVGRQVGTGRPRAGAGDAEPPAGIGAVDLAVQIGERIAELPPLPAVFRQPVVLRPHDGQISQVIRAVPGAGQAAADDRIQHRASAGKHAVLIVLSAMFALPLIWMVDVVQDGGPGAHAARRLVAAPVPVV